MMHVSVSSSVSPPAPFFPLWPHAIKMVVCDLDGTLVQGNLKVSDAVMNTIAECTAAGVKVVIATGRMYPSALPYAQRLGLHTPVVCYQGAVVRETQEPFTVLYENPVPLALAHDIATLCHEQDIHLNVYINDVLCSRPDPVYVEEYKRTSSIEPHLVEDIREMLQTDAPPKMVAINNNPAVLESLRVSLLERYGEEQVNVCKSRHNFLEITAAHVSKWNAIKALAAQWGIQPEEVMCLGDEENDLSMLVGEGLGIAMANGPVHIQQQARGIAPSILEDGAAHAMRHYALKTCLST
jgi:Cof subfamily protein (haloacid dehalogenase superfamily)